MLKFKSIDKNKAYSIIMNITMLFIIMQPIFDLLSFLYIRGYIPIGISTYGKPLIIGFINLALLFIYKKQIVKCAITYGASLLLMVGHTLLLKDLYVENSVIFHEIRFMINLIYMLLCYHAFKILYDETDEKDKYIKYLKKTLVITFGLYIVLYLIAVITGTSGSTYEYADALKHGYKGWMDSGQIFGHALCVCLPFITAYLLNNKAKNRAVSIMLKAAVALPVLVLCLIGTKVTYYIPIFVFGIQIVLEIFFAIKDKKFDHIVNGAICIICVCACILAYPLTPVKKNIEINNGVLAVKPNTESIADIVEKEKDKHNLKKPSNDTSSDISGDENNSQNKYEPNRFEKNLWWTELALNSLEAQYINGELHPADMRGKQIHFNLEKFKLADFEFKFFGIGYLNQYDMAIERDILCIVFSFGILGFLIMLARPIWLWLKGVLVILRRLLKTDIQTLCLFEGFSMFFFISYFAGYTIIYTNFSIFLAVVMVLLNGQLKKLENSEK